VPTPCRLPRAGREARPLTPAERDLVASLFDTAIDCDAVQIRRRKWWPFQPRRWTMAPDGNLWFHPDAPHYRASFATASLPLQAHFIHEMTHVWQHQRGICLPLARHPLCRYRYSLMPRKPLDAYGLEQQAEIMSHAFLLRNGAAPEGTQPVEMYEALLPSKG
jgi:hypothetical protein